MITKKDGSMEEAFPNEGSYCVTALVAYDLLCTIELLNTKVNKKTILKWKNIISPLIIFLKKHQENHAFISNHLATAAAALLRWYKIDNDREALAKSKEIINKIISKQSKEGWYLEYEGFDPGYQSLCTYYLSDIYQNYKSKKLEKSLVSSINFIKYFVHPDGSFGGAYGSRSTRIFILLDSYYYKIL